MAYTKGGRGKKAPYSTEIVRVPSPIRGIVDKLIEGFREKVESGEIKDYEDSQELASDLTGEKPVTTISKEEAIESAKRILRGKKSKKQGFEKLLQVIYGEDVSLD